MSNPYTAPSISGYNSSPPADDGSEVASNEVLWSTIKTKLADPLNTYAAAISSATSTAFGDIFGNAITAKSSGYTVQTSDRGALISCTNTITIDLLAAGTAGSGFVVAVKNDGTGVITIDGNGSETINGTTTIDLAYGGGAILISDGSNWIALTGGPPGNHVIQVVNTNTGAVSTGTTALPFDDTIPQNTEGDEYMTLAITPKSANNTLLIEAVVNLSNSNLSVTCGAALFQDSTANAIAATYQASNDSVTGMMHNLVLKHYMTAGTASSTTFKVRAGASTGATTTFNGTAGGRIGGGLLLSSITITEISE